MKASLPSAGMRLLKMSDIDIEKTEWIESFGNDFIIVQNPVFNFSLRHPYKPEQVVVVFCEDGIASGAINLKPYDLKKKQLLVVLSNQIIEAHYVSEDFKGTYIFMSPSFLSRLNIGDSYRFHENIEREPCFQLDERMSEAIRSYISMCRAMIQLSDQNPNTDESLHLLTRLFFLNLGWLLHHEAISKPIQSRQSKIMEDFISLVKTHYKEHRDVEYYAGRMHISAKYMSTCVKCVSGKSALQWIEEYVILDAKTQLSSTMNSIQQICYDLNFPTQSFFGRYFKRITGMSPSDYRHSTRTHLHLKTQDR